MGVNILSRLCTITEACKMWRSPIGHQFSSSSSKILIYWMDSAKQIITIAHISNHSKTSRNSKAPKFPPSSRRGTQQNSSRYLMLKRYRSWVLVSQLTKALIRWWIISRQTYLRNCSQILTFCRRCKESFQLSRVMAANRQIFSRSQTLISPRAKITSSILSLYVCYQTY